MKLHTKAVHAGDRKKLGDYIPVTTPIYGATSFFYDEVAELDRVFGNEQEGQSYSRYGNPTVDALEEQIAALEGGDLALATSSGMAAIHLSLLVALTDRRKSILAANVLYGQTISLLMNVLEPSGVEVRFADPCDLDAFEAAAADAKPSCVLIETVSNPMMRVPALDRVAEIAHRHNAVLVVDSTFTTPVLMRPLGLGADIVVHSATKYLSGHGDALGGILVAAEEFRQSLQVLGRTLGMNLGPFEAYLTMRGVKTLPLRVRKAVPKRGDRGGMAQGPSAHRADAFSRRSRSPRPRDHRGGCSNAGKTGKRSTEGWSASRFPARAKPAFSP